MNEELEQYFAESLTDTLEETSTTLGNKLVLEHLAKTGNVNLEEAEFYHGLTLEVITEMAEDFVPDMNAPQDPEAGAPGQEEPAPGMGEEMGAPEQGPEGEVFYDKMGNAFVFQDGQMLPVDGDDAGQLDPDDASDAMMDPDAPVDGAPEQAPAPQMDPNQMQESTGFAGELMEESDNVVARILANLK